ncbi:MAG: phosphoribosylglycinamide formyltransferase [Litorivicinaceae bacterium]|jgi:phosphoribosylglycinamide formyltransferase 1|nr:phosphoribosylglycinamide formyltransferase [Litorivicinaceae bacterium]MDP5329203.1 phosphoribosylglycinamide formyltransferase [Litorivicinaceae bacterium]MDP5331205.1 phosphoribosylglycinamide formyltransferase [Litorivicinaceae bacterium]MDP5340729.1 phosphoribosylglycinamide formyltransferase [Litorivicinaceae bacterium]MDP5342497.1 phosphoribosylglycinamide formyltransferase [Litorivicinaceae bacterium]
MRIVCLLSGSGTNLGALIEAQQRRQLGNAKLVGVFSNVLDAHGLQRARDANIATEALSHRAFSTREDFDRAVIQRVSPWQPDLIVLAGFMRIMSPVFVAHYHGRLINIHPSLLPKYRGLDTHRRALEAGDTEAGATVHWVTEELDGGDIIDQIRVPIEPNDTVDRLRERVLQAEHVLYPRVIRALSLSEKAS